MTAGWLIDADAFSAYHDELADAVVRNGYTVASVCRPKPPYEWDDVNSSYRSAFPIGACVVAHGDIDLVSRVLSDKRWTPGAFAAVPHFFCSHYCAESPATLAN